MPKMLFMRSAKRVFFYLVGIYALFVASLYFFQDWIIFKSKPLAVTYQFEFDAPYEEVSFSSEHGGSLSGVLFKAQEAKGAVLFYHGQGWDLSKKWRSIVRECLSRQHDVFVVSYRGFGKSRGRRNYKTLLSDAETAYTFLSKRYSPESIVIYGRSLGTGPATYVASRHNVQRLILESPYLSLLDTAASRYPVVPKAILGWMLKYPMRTDLWIQNVTCPIHIFHSIDDQVIPVNASRKLVECLAKTKSVSYTEIADISHDHVAKHPDVQLALDKIFIK